MKVELFKIDPSTRMVDLNKEWIGTIKEFKKILSRDRGSKGDMDGKRKLQATKEFTFIYHFCDYASKFDNYPEEEKLKECLANSDLPQDFDYTKDDDILAAVIRYKTLQESPALKVLNEAKQGLFTAHKVIRKIRKALETQLEATDLDELFKDVQEDPEKPSKKRIDDPITKISKALKSLMELTNEVGPSLRAIKDLEEDVKKELGDQTGLRGDREKGVREDAVPTQEPKTGMFDI